MSPRLRPAVELIPAVAALLGAALLWHHPAVFFPLPPRFAQACAVALIGFAMLRGHQAFELLRYRRGMLFPVPYRLAAEALPCPPTRLFLGRGFQWDRSHAQRLEESRYPEAIRWLARYREGGRRLPWLRGAEDDHHLHAGGDAALHGVGGGEREIFLDLDERNGHLLVLGTTRVGKTRAAEMMIAQDIRRGEVVFVFDPKGDEGLLRRVWAEAERAGRTDHLYIVHLGFPSYSARYNPLGDYSRTTELAGRVVAPLPSSGDNAAFRAFAWRFVNIIAQALIVLGRQPDYRTVARYLDDIEPLLTAYLQRGRGMGKEGGNAASLRKGERPQRDDPLEEGLRSMFEHDRTHYKKLVATLLPLLDKLTHGPVGELLSPQSSDGALPCLEWRRVIAEEGIVYVGLDALSDPEVAAAVGSAMFADLAAVMGERYKFGSSVMGGGGPLSGPRVCIHADEFNELIGREFVPLLNKAGGANLHVTAYTQTVSDVQARLGDPAAAGQVLGNFNSLLVFRVVDELTARVLTDKLPRVTLRRQVAESRVTDDNHPASPVDFISQNADRITEGEAPLVSPADLMQLPKGHAFALIEGGRLYKVRIPLLADAPPLAGDQRELLARWRQIHWREAPR